MYQNKTQMMRVLTTGLILLVGFSVYAEPACKKEISLQDKEEMAMARSWKAMDRELKKPMHSIDSYLSGNAKEKYERSLAAKVKNPEMPCGFKIENEMLHNPNSVGIEHGIKRYREIYMESNRSEPEVYNNVMATLTCPSDDDVNLKAEYRKAQQRAVNNLTYTAYYRLVQIKGEQERNPNDLSLIDKLKTQLAAIKPEVIRVGGDLEFLKRAEAFAESLEAKLKSKPEVLCKKSDKYVIKAFDAYLSAFPITK